MVLKNFLEGGYPGKLYAVNPNVPEVLGVKCAKSVADIAGPVDCAVIAIPALAVVDVLEQCGKKGIKAAVVISGGFGEVGNVELEGRLVEAASKHGMAVIGPNCMGVINPEKRVDSVFLPIYKLGRPHVGEISFISQSGAVGGCIVDLAARAGVGMSKFVSYGNASVVSECDLLEYLGNDLSTKIIVCYLEGVKDGKRFLQVASKITRKKPIVAIKAGKSKLGAQAAKSHTGSLAGSAMAYAAAFAQSRITEAETLDELFDFAKIFSQPICCANRVAVITNGGGNGVLAADAIEQHSLDLAKFSDSSLAALKELLPPYANARNPLDLIGDADSARFERAIRICLDDRGVDALVVNVLFQTAAIDTRIVSVLVKANGEKKKPIIVIATGGEYTEMHRRILESYGIPTYSSPSSGVKALSKFLQYCDHYKKFNKTACLI
ncbi:CoA-binding protein [Candidatus Parvarchaeota archaeon]|nr:CoA-binding protein [Candidatus Parvarchaeota archaeon]